MSGATRGSSLSGRPIHSSSAERPGDLLGDERAEVVARIDAPHELAREPART